VSKPQKIKKESGEEVPADIPQSPNSEAEAEDVAECATGLGEGGVPPTAPDLAGELEESKKMLQETEEKLLRMAADFENTKKRLQREKETSLKFAEENILKGLLPSVDNLERAIEQGRNNTEDASGLLDGVEMTCKGLLATLEKFGLKPLDVVGEAFDPNFHEALAMEASEEVPQNMILQEFQKGYMYKERLLRAAKVVVSKGKVED